MYLYDPLIHIHLLRQTACCVGWDQVCVDHHVVDLLHIVGPLHGFIEELDTALC